MANWNKIVITNAGMQLSTSTLAGSKIQYTHVQTTSTNLTTLTHDQLVALTKFDTVVQDLNIGTVSVADDHIVTIPVQVNNQDVTADYNLYGMAIFAKPTDGQEILYGVAIATVPDLIPAKGGTTVTSTDFNLKVHVGDSSNVEITVEQQMGVNADYVTGALKPYVLTTDLSVTLSKYTLKTDLPDFSEFEKTADINTKLEGYATNTYVDQQIGAIPKSDMSKYNTAAEADAKYAKETDYTELADKVNDASTGLPSKADNSKVVHTTDTVDWQKTKITADSGAPSISISTDSIYTTMSKVTPGFYSTYISGSPSDNPFGGPLKGYMFCDANSYVIFSGTLELTGQSVEIVYDGGSFYHYIAPLDADIVHTTGAETIAGDKNFTGAIQSNGVAVATSTDLTTGLATKQDTISYTPADDSTVLHNNTLNFMNQDNSGIVIGNDQNFGLIKRDGYTAGLAVGSGNTFKFFKTTDATLSNTSAYIKLWEIDSVGRVSINSGAFFTPADNSKVVHTTGNEEIPGNKNHTGALQKSGVDVATVDDVSDAKMAAIGQSLGYDQNTGKVSQSATFVNEQTFDKPSVGPNEGYIYDFIQSDNDTDAQTAAAALTEPGFVWAPEEG